MHRVSLLLMVFLPASASAQVAIEGRHSNPTEAYDIALHNPVECDDEIHAAATSWRNANATFSPPWGTFYNGNVGRDADEPNSQISFESATTFYNASAGAEVYRTWTNRYFSYGGSSYWIFSDADVIVNYDQYQYGQKYGGYFECGDASTPSTQTDFQTMMVHELGHTGGLGHHPTAYACTMSNPPYSGPYRALCSDTVTTMRGIYSAPSY